MAYADNVFINCPFDAEFEPLRYAIVFAILDCGFTPRCALEAANGGNVRFDSIKKLIEDSRFGLHDISRTELDLDNGLPRFNMPLELGVFIGASRYGNRLQKSKSILILDKEQYRYQKFISDIAGQDIRAHKNLESNVITCVRNWFTTESNRKDLPGGEHIFSRYMQFKAELPAVCKKTKIELKELTYSDYVAFAAEWVSAEPLATPD
ncbi:hypothetical protein HSX11_12145 [Oxalobacteraceae bacterium]|nr:hypothetical protein [Oxalobacteraceae bacterium]